jgi:hypothetical protein
MTVTFYINEKEFKIMRDSPFLMYKNPMNLKVRYVINKPRNFRKKTFAVNVASTSSFFGSLYIK